MIALLGVLAVERAAHAQMMSPGDLSTAHADIDGDSHCDDCHSKGEQVSESKCLSCHKELSARVKAGAGLHGKTYKGQACVDCHQEHIGRKTKLVRWPGGSMDKFDHDDAGWKLEGDHATTKCAKCHKKTNSIGTTTFLGNKSACGSCHKDEHDGRFGTTCLACHDQADWKNLSLDHFNHDVARYALTGGHTKVACEKCHGTPRKWKGLTFTSCESCHQDPHKGKFPKSTCEDCHTTKDWKTSEAQMRKSHSWLSLRNGHATTKCAECHDKGNDKKPSKGNACNDCHKAVHQAKFGKKCESCHGSIEWLGLPDRVGRDAHDKTVYPLEGKHVKVDCKDCHPKSKPEEERYRKLVYDRCGACHADKHAGEFASRKNGECATCHRVSGFRPTKFGVDEHISTAFVLEGRHVAVACGGCHGAKQPRLDFRIAKQACADCHQNPHGEQFAVEMKDGGCAHCHVAADWKQAKFDHSTWPLTGAHATALCGQCHAAAEASGAQPAQPAAYRGIPRDCDGCHDDVHAGQFRTEEPKKACEVCHTTTAFALPTFDHEQQSGYAIEGKHKAVACAKCHPTVQLANGTEATRYRLGYRRCRDCHADPHQGAE